MKKIMGGFLCAVFFFVQMQVVVSAEEDFSLYATAAVLMDADSGRVLYGKNADEPMAMASTTKIMTCITVLEQCEDIEQTLTVSSYAASMPKVKLYINKGEQYKVKDLLYSLMLESHNDSAVALAEYIGKNFLEEELQTKDTAQFTVEESKKAVAAFASLMNGKAKELGCENTHFITPNGLDAIETITLNNGETVELSHSTTAAELARIMSYCIKESPEKERFLEITRTSNYSFSANGRSFSCVNHNAFLQMMDGALSGKTGFTNKAGYCYVGALERDGKCFVVALLACGWPNNKTYKWSDTRTLMEYGIENYFFKNFMDADIAFSEKNLKPLPVIEGQTNILGETAYVNIKIADREITDGSMDSLDNSDITGEKQGLLLKEGETIEVKSEIKKELTAPVESGIVVGKIYYMLDNKIYKTEKIVTTQTIEKIDFRWCIEQIFMRFFL